MTASTFEPEYHERWTLVGGRRVYSLAWPADREGARAVVLLHGFVVSGAYFVPTAERLAGPYRVYAPDLPGFGRSEDPPGVLTVEGLASSLATWIAEEGLEGAALVANSFGCQVAVELVTQEPGLVWRLVLGSPTVDPAARSVVGQLRRLRREARTHSSALRRLLVRDYAAAGMRRILGTFRYALADRIEDKLPSVVVPTLVVRGTTDPMVPQAWAEEVTRRLPDGWLVVVPDAPHAMNFEAPDEFASIVRAFLDAEPPASSVAE